MISSVNKDNRKTWQMKSCYHFSVNIFWCYRFSYYLSFYLHCQFTWAFLDVLIFMIVFVINCCHHLKFFLLLLTTWHSQRLQRHRFHRWSAGWITGPSWTGRASWGAPSSPCRRSSPTTPQRSFNITSFQQWARQRNSSTSIKKFFMCRCDVIIVKMLA